MKKSALLCLLALSPLFNDGSFAKMSSTHPILNCSNYVLKYKSQSGDIKFDIPTNIVTSDDCLWKKGGEITANYAPHAKGGTIVFDVLGTKKGTCRFDLKGGKAKNGQWVLLHPNNGICSVPGLPIQNNPSNTNQFILGNPPLQHPLP